jgi:hypothetical protein
MPTLTKEIELLARIQGLIHRNNTGLTAGFGEQGGVVIERRGHVRGIWRCLGGEFAWTPAGYNEPVHEAADIEAAVAYTQALLQSS